MLKVGAQPRTPSEIVGIPNNFTFFSFCPFIKGYGLADLYEMPWTSYGSIDLFELIRMR